MRIMIFGVNGMLGCALFKRLGSDPALRVQGIMRGDSAASIQESLEAATNAAIVGNISSLDDGRLTQIMAAFRPTVIINCVGWRRQPLCATESAEMIVANSLFPHRLAGLARDFAERLIHFSSDAVFSGRRGGYREEDVPDPADAYGLSKRLGEPDYPHCLILRTSLIGHAHQRSDQLVDWFLRQKGQVDGYRRAIFSGLPTAEVASIVRDVLLPRTELCGIWHLAAQPISKFELLSLIAERYGIDVEVTPAPGPAIDRSLDATRFRSATGYVAPSWPELIDRMHRSK